MPPSLVQGWHADLPCLNCSPRREQPPHPSPYPRCCSAAAKQLRVHIYISFDSAYRNVGRTHHSTLCSTACWCWAFFLRNLLDKNLHGRALGEPVTHPSYALIKRSLRAGPCRRSGTSKDSGPFGNKFLRPCHRNNQPIHVSQTKCRRGEGSWPLQIQHKKPCSLQR